MLRACYAAAMPLDDRHEGGQVCNTSSFYLLHSSLPWQLSGSRILISLAAYAPSTACIQTLQLAESLTDKLALQPIALSSTCVISDPYFCNIPRYNCKLSSFYSTKALLIILMLHNNFKSAMRVFISEREMAVARNCQFSFFSWNSISSCSFILQ